MKKILLVLVMILLVGCNKDTDIDKFKTDYEALNNSSINMTVDSNTKLINVNAKETLDLLKNGTGIIYFGFPACPWCRNIVPVLFDFANKNNTTIYYLHTRGITEEEQTTYDEIKLLLNDYLETDSDGNKKLYVPDVYFVKDGEIVGHHLGSVDSQTDPSIVLNDEQKKELYNIYEELYKKIEDDGMVNKIINSIISLFGGITKIPFGKEILVFIISMLPILELRGGILAAALLDMTPLVSYIVCVIGNILVIPIALFFLEFIFKLLRHIKFFDKIITKIENKCLSKRSQLDKYGFLGLLLFVGIPIPGTGAWTGCFLASILGMDKKKSFLAAMGGVILASVIMMILSFGLIKNIF